MIGVNLILIKESDNKRTRLSKIADNLCVASLICISEKSEVLKLKFQFCFQIIWTEIITITPH